MAVIAWIGLGHMGGPMTANLVRAGHQVRGYDLSEEASRAAAEHGVEVVDSIAAAVDGVDVVFSMVPKGEHALAVYSGPDGVFAHAAKGTLLVDSSTIDVASAQELHDRAREAGFRFVDAPVSGGTGGATRGTLTFMAGGAADDVEEARAYIEPMAGNIIATGGPTTGQAAKICNNLMALINMTGLAEAATLADRLGLDHRVFQNIASVSSGGSWVVNNWYPPAGVLENSPANNDFAATFACDLALKDMNLAVAAADQTGTALEVGRLSTSMYQRLSDAGSGGLDCSAVAKIADGSFGSGGDHG